MKRTLSENIRTNRHNRGLTQEQLAQVLGVTPGAVHKWESGLSVPELETIVQIAVFFDTSVDALLGYTLQNHRIPHLLQQLEQSCRYGDPNAIQLAEQFLVKYPNSFSIVYHSAMVYLLFGQEQHRKDLLSRSVSLFEHALLLIDQNTDPTIGQLTIFGNLANAHISLGNYEKGLDLLKQHNDGGIFSSSIASCLSIYMDHPAEAQDHLTNALTLSMRQLFDTIAGFVFVYRARHDYRSALDILLWGHSILTGMKTGSAPDFLDKLEVNILILLAWAQLKQGSPSDCRSSLVRAFALARHFDSAPDYGIVSLRFASIPEQENLHDSISASALDGAENLLSLLADPMLDQLWKETVRNA